VPAPRQIVADPTAFAPSPYGLLSVANPPPTDGPHWQGGVTWQAMCVTGVGTTYDDFCAAPLITGSGNAAAASTLTPNIALLLRGAQPFTVYAEFDCSPVGNADAQNKAEQALAQGGSWAVERAFWTGFAQGQPIVMPHLADDTQTMDGSVFLQTVPVTGGSATTDIATALGFLEQAIANCGNALGVIHVPAAVFPTLDAWGLVTQQGQTLVTKAGNRVAVGNGYPGTAPSGAAPAAGTSWLYATGPVFVISSQTRINIATQSLDRTENTIRMVAERNYLVGWDCCHAGVLAKLGVPVPT